MTGRSKHKIHTRKEGAVCGAKRCSRGEVGIADRQVGVGLQVDQQLLGRPKPLPAVVPPVHPIAYIGTGRRRTAHSRRRGGRGGLELLSGGEDLGGEAVRSDLAAGLGQHLQRGLLILRVGLQHTTEKSVIKLPNIESKVPVLM